MLSAELINKIIKFREDRNWKQFHSIKDLCSGLSIEVSELQEIFLWKNEEEVNNVLSDKQSEISDEIADILIFIVYLADTLDIDMTSAVTEKIRKNELKYPIDKSKNSNKKYTEL